jgi:hypothetical protein
MGQPFPTNALFSTYTSHPLRFSQSLTVNHLTDWDKDFVFYLIYNRKPEVGRDIDHIHPQSRLEGFRAEKVHSIANYQLLDIETNRDKKRAKPLAVWLDNFVSDSPSYLTRHLIPTDEALWLEENFDQFVKIRAEMLVAKVQEFIPAAPVDSISPEQIPMPPATDKQVDLLTLSQLPPNQQDHSILQDKTELFDLFQKHVGANWAGRYRNELERFNIRTIADFARVVMYLKLEIWYDAGYAKVYRFHKPLNDGQKIHFNQKNFGGWAWETALNELEKRGFDWQLFVMG